MEPYISATNGGRNFFFEFSLLEYDGTPIVFLCTDEAKHIFLCECTDTRFGEQNWTISFTDYDTVKLLINRQISLFEALNKSRLPITLAAYNYDTEEFTQRTVMFDQLEPENLPEQNTMIWLTNAHAVDDVNELFMEHSSPTVLQVGTVHSLKVHAMMSNSLDGITITNDEESSYIGSGHFESGFTCNRKEAEAA